MFLVGEMVVRYRSTAYPFDKAPHVPDHLTQQDATLRWRYPPQDGRNRLGLRNREVGPKLPGTYRILFLGDSLIYSGETSSKELYTLVLEHRLNAGALKTVHLFEIVNAGVPGYTTYQELEFLKIYGLGMEPDLVVLGFVFNDVYYPYLHRPTEQKLLGAEPTIALYRFNPYKLPQQLFAWSYLAHDLVDRSIVLWQRALHRPVFAFERRIDFYLAWKSYGWIHTRRLIAEMKGLLAERGTPMAVLVFPIRDQMNDQYRKLDEAWVLYPQGKIREICDDLGIPRLDLTEAIYRNGGAILFRDYLHLNAKGNDLVVDELERYLAAELVKTVGRIRNR